MKRWIMHLVAICSALLALAMLAHWIYSWSYFDGVNVRIGRNAVGICTAQGHARIMVHRYVPEAGLTGFFAAEYYIHYDLRNTPLPQAWRTDHSFLGIGFGSGEVEKTEAAYIQFAEQTIKTNTEAAERAKARGRAGPGYESKIAAQWQQRLRDLPRIVQMFELPNWLMVVLFGALPAWWFPRVRRERRRQRRGMCLTCGYDLRATPDRCPECGSVPGMARTSRAE